MRNEAVEAAAPDGSALRAEFLWHGDRFAHRISLIHRSGAIVPLLESLEGTPADDWPPSPPLQSLTIENRTNGRTVALLVGMAGGSHWSASVETLADAPELIFDVACRHNKRPTFLGSRYRKLIRSMDTQVCVTDQSARLSSDDDTVVIEPIRIIPAATSRWSFKICLP